MCMHDTEARRSSNSDGEFGAEASGITVLLYQYALPQR
jgi:hypothetical protein